MSTFAPIVNPPQEKLPDPSKHVNFTNGMVLGVDEFQQEFAYLQGRDQWLARDLIGYGTVCGLRVAPQQVPSRGFRVNVEAGAALSPRGQLIRVPKSQCAYLDDWWAERQGELEPGLVVDGVVRAAITLCYRDCQTDWLPQPGEPCRTEEETAAATRVQDDYLLELRWQAPEQREEDALRDFAAWLREIEVSEETPADPAADLLAFEAAIRAALGAQPVSPPEDDYLLGSPPEGLHIPQGLSCEYLRAAFRIWTTELRPRWNSAAAEAEAANPAVPAFCCGVAPENECVLLGEVIIPVVPDSSGAWVIDAEREVTIDQERRPFVLHLRMLQEWMVCGRLVTPGDTVEAETSFGLLPDAGTSEQYSRANHTHGTPELPDLAGDVSGPMNDNHIAAIQGTPVAAANNPSVSMAAGDALTLVDVGDGALEWQPVAPDGDVIGALDANTVRAIQEVPVVYPSDSLQAGRVLKLVEGDTGLEWQPAEEQGGELPDLGGDVTGAVGGNQVASLQQVALTYPPESLQEGHTLTLVNVGSEQDPKLEWQPAAGQGSADGPFVEHPDRFGRYEIAAAGWVDFVFREGENSPNSQVHAPYGGLKLLNTEYTSQLAAMHSLIFDFQFFRYQERFNDAFPYVIKVTPWITPDGKFAFIPAVFDINPEFFRVVISFPRADQANYIGRIQVEVSLYQQDGGNQ